jgi:DNA segregation ATPase FtsK/SpoIIIE, S-DNA-T family
MAKKQSKKKKDGTELESRSKAEKTSSLQEETVRIIYAIICFLVAIFLIFAAIYKAGIVGEKIYGVYGGADGLLTFLLGVGYFLVPVLLCVLGLLFVHSIKKHTVAWPRLLGALIFLLSSLGVISILFKDETGSGRGGLLGNIIATPLMRLFDFWVSLIFLGGLLVIASIIIFETRLTFRGLMFWRKDPEELVEGELVGETPLVQPVLEEKPIPEPVIPQEPQKKFGKKDDKKEEGMGMGFFPTRLGKPFVPPPLSLLEQDKGKPGVGDIKANANIIKRTLQNFGINVEMDEINIGPSVTRYALKPAEGVKLARIVGLQNDLSLALAAHPLRIEAPIPGKSLVGIEIPNTSKTMVGLGTMLGSDDYQNSDKPLLISLGKGVSGKNHFANLAKMPHLLIAGATGSGKSVTIHTILMSLLYRNSPENLKFIMIDPKRVELTLYNNIPHLLTPVITDPKKSILALKWAAKEMDRRYDILEEKKVRDIESYHKNVLAPSLKKLEGKDLDTKDGEAPALPEMMPYIVIIIDELADLMQTYPRELESAIVRLAQMSRAVGIHLMLSTQRPSVNIITGLIKANIPSRIALQVTSQVDSRTILDASGAEKLLGAGDMLFMTADMAKPTRVQNPFVSESELKSVVKYLIDNYADELPSEINLDTAEQGKNSIFDSQFEDADGADEDDLYEEAREIVISAGKASTSYLQRKLRVGYARAARLIDMLEERGVIGPGEGAKPREVIGGGASASGSATEFEENQL